MTDQDKARLQTVVDKLVANKTNPNRLNIIDKLTVALADNKTYLAISAPTSSQNTAQIKSMARQNNKIIRLLVNLLDATD